MCGRSDLDIKIKTLKVDPGDVFVVRYSEAIDQDVVNATLDAVGRSNPGHLLVILRPGEDFDSLDEEGMQTQGWARVSKPEST